MRPSLPKLIIPPASSTHEPALHSTRSDRLLAPPTPDYELDIRPTLSDLAIHFDMSAERTPPLLHTPVTLPLPAKIPYSSLLNKYADIIRICPPSTIGPLECYKADNPRAPVPLYIEFPLDVPTPDEPWTLSDATPRVPIWNYREVYVPFLGIGVIMDFIDVSSSGGTMVITLRRLPMDRIYIRVPRSRLPISTAASISDDELLRSRSTNEGADSPPQTPSRLGPFTRLKRMLSFQYL
ncbi:hypothetical protein FKP32DRAFT_1670361 [Trametes sanguinea]|nr:hypothetical protein FKP32DRAFT_1680562 [Trametes sanguinea]KAI9060903.1 hypothetical protein FKP32DRAFT_1678646 [Trametes sanguinea]KAI9061408.1 hypothetical protein FKP32DRAFT_1678144 [Trametes sanguinea]KAI9061514.1 hypothetical protein FKP32DRAFT_1678140 [Trametes sanguinea]KAI9063733.1 hypothetical protein FKP32DRAFT_1676161 [Trametes sanguinea]